MRKMKDSGILWIGEIPAGWEVYRLRFLASITTGSKDTINRDPNGEYPFYVRSPHVERIATYTFDGEAILMAGDGVGAGKVFHYVTGKFDYHQRVYNIHNFKIVTGKYLYYFLRENFLKKIEEHNAKSTVDSVRLPMLLDFPVVLTNATEQQHIADFLDSKCASIDRIIEKQRTVIEKLKAYKHSVITEAVTKGLNPDVPMKDSDIEWIGEIPEHWEIKKIKFLFHVVNVRNQDKSAILLSLFTAIGVKPRTEMKEKGNKATTVENYKIVLKNDLIVNKLLAWMGAIGYSDYNGVTSPDYDVYRAHGDANVVRNYYHHYFRDTHFKDDCYKYGHGIMMMRWRTYPDEFKSIPILNPPHDEQLAIADSITAISLKIDKLITAKESIIKKLTSYKQSLIYEAVTGKMEI